jgi:hypothetical protein
MNSLYNRLMAEKGAPRAANNPNTTQLRSAPMNLRSAMQKYAVGGGVGSPPPSAGDINSFVQANIGNPQAIMQAAQQYGVSMDDLANATGYSSGQINDYFENAGYGTSRSQPIPPQIAGSGTFNVPPRPDIPDESMFVPPFVPPPSSIPPTFMPNEGLNEPEVNFGSFVPEYFEKASNSVETENPSMFSPDPNPIQGRTKNLGPVQGVFNGQTISPELLRKIQESMRDPFGSQLTQQDELMKLIQLLKGT